MPSPSIRIDDNLVSISQRGWLVCVACSIFVFLLLSSSNANELEFNGKPGNVKERCIRSLVDLEKLAMELASKPFEASPALPQEWANLSYDEYRKVVFDPNKAIWRSDKAPFFLEAFHRGFVHRDQVTLYEIGEGKAEAIPFRGSMFDYRGDLDGKSLPSKFGFAGFRVVGKFPTRDDWQEMLTFLGASYFRARTATGVYGASARGLAIDVGLNKPEEFPVFRVFWVEKPPEGATKVRAFALMDSPGVVGAYQFQFEPGLQESHLNVDTSLVFRHNVERVGIAPLTSMWMWGDGLNGPLEDSRPEVHDSDSLVICADALDHKEAWTCRSLMRPNYPSIVQFRQERLKGFGLIQRDVQLEHYQDNEAKYHLRPSIWVAPTTEWGKGAIHLLELPAEHEGIDNMAVWWTPSNIIPPLQPYRLSYRISFASGDPTRHPLMKVIVHRVKRPKENQKSFEFGLDFASGDLTQKIIDASTVDVVCSGVRCEVAKPIVTKNSDGLWKVGLVVHPTTEGDSFELRVQLLQNGRPVSETWSYLCPIQPPPVSLPPWRQKP